MKTAIDIGSYYIKIIEGTTKKNRIVIKKIGYLTNPFNKFRVNLAEREQDVIVKELKAFRKSHGITSKHAICNISGPSSIIHYFEIPQIPEEEVKNALNLEIMQFIPGGTKNLEYDYIIFPGKTQKRTVLFIGYPKDKCDFFVNTLQRAGWKPLIMDQDAIAVLNSFRFFNPEEKETLFILHMGFSNTNLILYAPDGFTLIRDIPFGGKLLADHFARLKNISSQEALISTSKKEMHAEIKEALKNNFEDIYLEIERCLEYFQTKTKLKPSRLYITGGTSLSHGFVEALQEMFFLQVHSWNPIQQLDSSMPIPPDIKEAGNIFSVCTGLLLREI